MLGLKILLGLLAALLLVLTGTLAALFWHRWRGGAWPTWLPQPHLLRFSPVALAVMATAAATVSWWLLHLGAVPFGQAWVLGAAGLYLLTGVAWLLLNGQLRQLRVTPATTRAPLGFGYALTPLVLLLAILLLVSLRPV